MRRISPVYFIPVEFNYMSIFKFELLDSPGKTNSNYQDQDRDKLSEQNRSSRALNEIEKAFEALGVIKGSEFYKAGRKSHHRRVVLAE